MSWIQFLEFTDVCAVYFTLQLVRCVMFSFAWIGLVMLLRKTLFTKLIFAKGILWASFLVVPFLGKMKLFYEDALVLKATWWLTGSIMTYTWIARVYMAVVLISFLYTLVKRARLQRIVSRMKKHAIGGGTVYITDMNITPFAVGLLRPKIILPQIMADNYSRDEIEAIILHEKTHIRLGHLWCYFVWDILRCLLWLDPLLTLCQKYFQEDLEAVCDRVCIQSSGGNAYEYGLLLLKSLKLFRAEQKHISAAAAYAGKRDFKNIKGRMEKIAAFKSYRTIFCRCIVLIAAVCLCIFLMGIDSISYARCNDIENMMVYEYDAENGNVVIIDSSDRLKRMISYDEDYVYVDSSSFEALLREHHAEREIYIVFGGFQKLPGIGGGGDSCLYQANPDEKTVRLPYEKVKDNWSMTLFKML